ncbi:MAG TPA: RNA 2'-phosphotransferase [bacterium]|nr:RNA 2'-phosphotransferase [bacterium]
MIDRRQATRLSKFLSLVLRHRPDDYGLEMDDRGAVDLSDLIDVLVAEDILADDAEAAIQELVEGSERRRFAIENGRMRALYGHSARVRLSLPEHDPPDTLYHGTTYSEAREIQDQGLRPAERAHVHLSGTREEAFSVGRRHTDDPVLLEIDTALARESGVKFSQASDVIWLSDAIPLEAIRFPELPEAPPPPPARPAPSPSAAVTPSAAAGARVAEDSGSQEFRRRTRKKSTGRR